MKKFVGPLIAIAVLIGGIYLLTLWSQARKEGLPGRAVAAQGRNHIAEAAAHEPYNTTPPTSGPHYGYTAPWGVHAEHVADEVVVHNLEHGGVIVNYDCNRSGENLSEDERANACEELVSQLTDITTQYRVKVLQHPYEELDYPIVLTAWGRIMELDRFDKDLIQKFIRAFRDKGPERTIE
ncbi:MAG: DUF3105 domain-containing protein [Parcubacteria group bacterium]|nr:DUF3105 domain-containing protein [Parcubacteria group bacterium]